MFSTTIAHYEVAVGTFPGAQDVVPRRSVGEATAYLATNVSLADGRTYYATVWATDLVGMVVRYACFVQYHYFGPRCQSFI